MSTASFQAGALIRRDVRAALDILGLDYREHKAWLDSVFVIQVPPEARVAWRRFSRWAEESFGDDES